MTTKKIPFGVSHSDRIFAFAQATLYKIACARSLFVTSLDLQLVLLKQFLLCTLFK